MAPGKKLKALQAMQKEGKKGVVVDKTFGLKNKGKSQKVQRFVNEVQANAGSKKAENEKVKCDRKMLRQAEIDREMEMKALFSEGLSITVKKRDLHKKKSDSDAISRTGGGGGGGGEDHYDDAWAEAELEKAGFANGALEQRIDKAREALKAEGKVGTPVTAESFALWKKRKADALLEAKEKALKREQLKKKSKGLSIFNGRDLFALKREVFDLKPTDEGEGEGSEDGEAFGKEDYRVKRDQGPDDGLYDENGALRDQPSHHAHTSHGTDADDAAPPPPHGDHAPQDSVAHTAPPPAPR